MCQSSNNDTSPLFLFPSSLCDSSPKTLEQYCYLLGVSELYYINSPSLSLGEVAQSAGGVCNRILT